MMTWILTLTVIVIFSAVILELFEESDRSDPLSDLANETGGIGGFRWETMTDSDLDALLQEFCVPGDYPPGNLRPV